MKTHEKALLCARIVGERKAVEPILFDVSHLTSFADYFLIAGGHSTRQVQAISRHMAKSMREAGYKAYGIEGEQEGQWILMDYGDIVIHLFYQPIREYYDLEGLWSEAPRLEIEKNEKKRTP